MGCQGNWGGKSLQHAAQGEGQKCRVTPSKPLKRLQFFANKRGITWKAFKVERAVGTPGIRTPM